MYIVDPQKIDELCQDVKFMMVPPCCVQLFHFFWGTCNDIEHRWQEGPVIVGEPELTCFQIGVKKKVLHVLAFCKESCHFNLNFNPVEICSWMRLRPIGYDHIGNKSGMLKDIPSCETCKKVSLMLFLLSSLLFRWVPTPRYQVPSGARPS